MTLVWRPGYGGAAVSDPDAMAYLRAVEEADNQALEQGVQQAVNQFVIGCKNDGIWDAIKASCILAGARTLDGALVPLVGTAPTNYNFVAGDYERETGLKGDGSTKYLDSNRNNNADPQDSNHNAACVTATDTVIGTSVLMAGDFNETGANNIGFSASFPNTFYRNRSSNATGILGGQNVTGLIGINRSSSTEYQVRFGGSNQTVSEASEAPSSGNILVFSRSDGGSTNARLSFYSIGEALDLALLDARVTNLMTAIGAAIP